MKKQFLAIAFITFTALTTIPAFASAGATFKTLAKVYRHAFLSSFHDVHNAKCVEIYKNGEKTESVFEFIKDGLVVTATKSGEEDVQYKFSPSVWGTSYVADGERNGSKFKLHARETLDGDFILKMTTRTLGVLEHTIGYISCSTKE